VNERDQPVVRCHGCGVLNVGARDECRACGTVLGARDDAAPVEPVVSVAGQGRAASRVARIGGVGRVFLATLAITVSMTIAGRLGAPDAVVDALGSATFVLVALGCLFVARAPLGRLLVTTGGWRGVASAAAALGVMAAFGAVYFRALGAFGFPLHHPSNAYVEAGWPRWAPFLFVAVLPGIFEEIVFRGYVMARLEELLSPGETLVVQAALFSVLHLGVAIFPSHFGIGLLLGVLRRRTRSLYPGMAVHMSWNALVVWAELLGRSFP
jgi:membrane protease YdiL (CAAX protease family)